MPIAALSEDTVCAITSSLVLYDAISAVKELIDNALDSRATNITIEISANTLDIIQVKDNGSGIGLEDRQLLCKRGCTSKIRTLEDLTELGGASLGFRGEALASIAELSESLTFTTRVEGEPVGTLLKFDARGKLISSSSASHGTGTTVKIFDFLKTIPVRQQATQKKAPKLLAGIKHLLFEYAFARPTTRLQLRVLKSKSDFKGNWSYAASQDASDLSIIASKIVGKEVVKYCKHEAITSDDGLFTIESLLLSKLQDKSVSAEQFVSVDGRPLKFDSNLTKELQKVYRKYAQTLVPEEDTLPRRLFLVVRLSCPRGSYDVNIEPTKDEVMFEDMGVITELFEKLCKQTYGEIANVNIGGKSNSASTTPVKQNSFDILLAKRPATIGVEDTHIHDDKDQQARSQNNSQLRIDRNVRDLREENCQASWPKCRNNASTISKNSDPDSSLEAGNVSTDTLDLEDEAHVLQPQIFNPFVLAKINTRVSQNNPKLHSSLQPQSQKGSGASRNGFSDQEASASSPEISTEARATPRRIFACPSQQSPATLPFGHASKGQADQEMDEVRSQSTPSVLSTVQSRTPELLLPILRTPVVNSLPSASPTRSDVIDLQQSQPIEVPYAGTRQLGSESIKRLSRGGAAQHPFRTPFKKAVPAATPSDDGNLDPYPTPESAPKNVRSGNLLFLHPPHSKAVNEIGSELDDIMEFEHRKREHILQHRSKSRPVKQVQSQQQYSLDEQVPADQNDRANILSIISSKALYEARFNSGDLPHVGPPPGLGISSLSDTLNVQKVQKNQFVDETSTVTTKTRSSLTLPSHTTIDSTDTEVLVTQMHQSDPRAFLIRSQAQATEDRPASKLAKSRTTMLPFESIIDDTATHRIRACLDCFNTVYVTENHCLLQELDASYACSGIIKYSFDESPSGEEALEICKVAALRMVKERGNLPKLDGVLSSYDGQQ